MSTGWALFAGLMLGMVSGSYLTQLTFEKQLTSWQIDRPLKGDRK